MIERVLVICGPTGSGKSALALAVAEAFNGIIINADSMQLYRSLRILTAQPDAEDLARAPHRLYGILSAITPASAAKWRIMALDEIHAAKKIAKLPILVGGTGLYLHVLAHGLATVPNIPPEVHAKARLLLEELGSVGLHASLQTCDPAMAARLHPSDRQRLLRAWEVITATGQSLADWQRQDDDKTPIELAPIVLSPSREVLYEACNQRFLEMIRAGALSEVTALKGIDPELPLMKAVGVRELLRHLHGEITLEDAISQAQQATRNYAKRQLTWFRHQMKGANWINEKYSESLDQKIFSFIRQFSLTPFD